MAITTEQLKSLKKRHTRKRIDDDQTWGQLWRDVSDYILPRRGRYFDRTNNRDGKIDRDSWRKVINGSAQRNIAVAVSGMRGGLCPHTLPWFQYQFADPDLNKWGPAREWLKQCEAITYQTISNGNFYSATESVFAELTGFGTAPVLVLEDKKTAMRCYPWTAGEYVLLTDSTGRIDTAFRSFQMSARSLAERFGKERLSDSTKRLLENNPDTLVDVVHAIYPRDTYDNQKLGGENKRYGSCFWEDKSSDEEYLRESGYNSIPFMAPRWTVIGDDVYGSSSLGMEVLGDVKMLQKLEKDKLRLVATAASPPMSVPSGLNGGLNMNPGGKNVMTGQQREALGRILDPNVQGLMAVAELIRQTEERIARGTYNDLFLMMTIDKAGMTATEVARRHEEKLAILSPVIERQNSEFLDAFHERAWEIQMQAGMFPPAPSAVAGQEISIDYISLLAQAQKLVMGVQPIERILSIAGGAAQLNPDVLDKIDFDKAIDEYALQINLYPEIIRKEEEVKKMRDDRKAQAQQQMAIDQAQQMANAAKSMGNAKTDENSALGKLMGGQA